MRCWAAPTLHDNTVMLSHFKMHFDILYTWANTHIYALHALEWKGQEAVWEKLAEVKKRKRGSAIPITQQSILLS